MSAQEYKKFISIYKKTPQNLTQKDIAMFHAILNTASFKRGFKLRFLGDDLCDRGMNDYYNLNIFKTLDKEKVDFEITLSNHNSFFIEAYERPEQSFSYNPYGPGNHESVVRSMLNLGILIELTNQKINPILSIISMGMILPLILLT